LLGMIDFLFYMGLRIMYKNWDILHG